MKRYEAPLAELIVLCAKDIIALSDPWEEDPENWDEVN